MNRRFQAFQEFLATQSVQVPLWGFIVNLTLAAVLAYILGRFYIRYGTSLSNRRQFAQNFILLTMTTTFVIAIIKTSLALSLGLVGALSIVRFRAAIKEPEELAYLFLNIAIGLGLGAEQRVITITAFALTLVAIWFRSRHSDLEEKQNLFLTVSTRDQKNINLDTIVDILKKHCAAVNLKRFDENDEHLEASFLVELDDFQQLNHSKSALRNLDKGLQITFLDTQ